MKNMSEHEIKNNMFREKMREELEYYPRFVTEYFNHLYEQKKSDNTIEKYMNALILFLRTTYHAFYVSNEEFFRKATPTDVQLYFNKQKNWGVNAFQHNWSALNSFFVFLSEKKYIRSNPMQYIQRPIDSNRKRKLNYLTQAELFQLLATVKKNPIEFLALRDEVFIKLAVSTGLDITKLLDLDLDEIDFLNGNISIVDSKGTRQIPIGRKMRLLLKEWCEVRKSFLDDSNETALFISSNKSRLSVKTAPKILDKYCEQAKITKISYKDLKSTLVYLLAKRGVSMEDILTLIDTSDYMAIVQAYDAAIKEKEVDIFSAINQLFDVSIPQSKANTHPLNELGDSDLDEHDKEYIDLDEYDEEYIDLDEYNELDDLDLEE